VGARIGYVLGLLVHDKVVVEMYSSLIVYFKKQPLKYGDNKHNRTRSILFIYTKAPSVTIQGNITVIW